MVAASWLLCYIEASRWRRHQSPAIIILSQVLWDDVWQRPQQFAMRAAERGIPVIFCAPVPSHTWPMTLRGRWRASRLPNPNLLVLSPIVLGGQFRSRAILAINNWFVAPIIAPGVAPTIFVNSPFLEPLATRIARQTREAAIVFDLIDDFASFSWAGSFSRELQARLLRRAQVVFTGTHELLDMI